MTKEKYAHLFRSSIQRYAPISDASFAQLKAIARLRTVEKGEFVLPMGQVAKKMQFVCQGILVSQFITPEGNIHLKNFFLEGYFAGSTVSMLQASPSAFAIQALEASVLIEFDYQKYRYLIQAHEDLKDFYIAYLEQSWIISNEKRQIAFATQTAAERYQTFLAEYPTLDKRVAQHYVASYLGITPTQLSRIRKEMKQ